MLSYENFYQTQTDYKTTNLKKEKLWIGFEERFPVMELGTTSSWSGARLRFQQHPPIKAAQRYLIVQSKLGHKRQTDFSHARSEAKRLLGNRWSWYHIPRVAICVKTYNTRHTHTPILLWFVYKDAVSFGLSAWYKACVCSCFNLWPKSGLAHTWSLLTRGHITWHGNKEILR